MKNILVTGGMGYIGSHTVVELLNKDYSVIVVDNLSNSNIIVKDRIKEITGKDIIFYNVDCCNYEALKEVFKNNKIDGIIHFAGYKAVGEGEKLPVKYYDNNLISFINVIKLMDEFKVNNLVFSSSATVYGQPDINPIEEDFPFKVYNTYGRTKLMIEDMIRDYSKANKWFNAAILRYFNPVGAHESGLIGEDPNGIPNNLAPYIAQVAIGRLDKLGIFGDNYDTKDGTGVRDYIHVSDLAYGHVLAFDKLFTNPGLVTYNLGTGVGYSVYDVLHAFEKACGFKIPYEVKPRRDGDVAIYYASPKKAYEELGFKTKYDIFDMARDAWNFQKKNPNGYNK